MIVKDEEAEKKVKKIFDLILSGLRSGQIHTISIVATGEGSPELYANTFLDKEKVSEEEAVSINLKMVGALFSLMRLFEDHTTRRDIGHRVAKLQVVDEADPDGEEG